MCLFLKRLLSKLQAERPGYKQNTIFQLDGARYHTSEDMRNYVANQGLYVVIGGPYGYNIAPVEMFFAALKATDINPDRAKTGKR